MVMSLGLQTSSAVLKRQVWAVATATIWHLQPGAADEPALNRAKDSFLAEPPLNDCERF
jgi:hypothetical protein